MEVKTVDLHFDTKTTPKNFNEAVTYMQHVTGCWFEFDAADGMYKCKEFSPTIPLGPDKRFTHGHFFDTQGKRSMLIAAYKPHGFLKTFDQLIDDNLNIQWCPEQHHFVVVVEGTAYKLRSSGTMYVPLAEERVAARLRAGEGVVWSADFSRAWMSKKGMPIGEVSLAEALEISEELSLPVPPEVQVGRVDQAQYAWIL